MRIFVLIGFVSSWALAIWWSWKATLTVSAIAIAVLTIGMAWSERRHRLATSDTKKD